MRKLFVLALAVVFGVMIFGGAMYTEEDPNANNYFSNVTLTGDATINVHQWLDASFTPEEFDIYDYTGEGDNPIDIILGELWLDSNSDVSVSVTVELGNLSNYITYQSTYPSGLVDANNVTYNVKLVSATVDANTPADKHTVTVTIILNPNPNL